MKRLVIMVAGAWTLLVVMSLHWNGMKAEEQIFKTTMAEADAYFIREQVARNWIASLKGIYTKEDLTGNSSNDQNESFHKVNSITASRLLNELLEEKNGVQVHLTSLLPRNPDNLADPWETAALVKLAEGETEVKELALYKGREHLRVLRPSFVEKSCLKCHTTQNYMVGDIIGGVTVSIPMAVQRELAAIGKNSARVAHGVIWFAGMMVLWFNSRRVTAGIFRQHALADKLQVALDNTESLIDSVPFGVVIIGKDKIVRKANQEAMKILGRQEGEIVGQICHQNFCPSEVGHCPILDDNMVVDRSERYVLDAEGKMIPVFKTVIPFKWQGDEVLLEVFSDISDRKRHEKEMVRTLRDLQKFNRLAIGREMRMIELKAEVNVLLEQQGDSALYNIVSLDNAPEGLSTDKVKS